MSETRHNSKMQAHSLMYVNLCLISGHYNAANDMVNNIFMCEGATQHRAICLAAIE